MTETERIEFAAAAMTCKRLGLMSHTTAGGIGHRPGLKRNPCLAGRINHDYKGSLICIHCGNVKASKPRGTDEGNRLKGLDLS
jgi:hypothetical protein